MISVLYVDDEPGLLELVRLYLEQDGQFTVDTISSAGAALTLLDRNRYDCIVSDYMMPELDGIRFLKMVRASKNTIPFILFTGRGREEVIIQAIDEGADFYIQKGGDPVPQFTELAHKIQQAVDKRRAEKQLLDSQAQLRTIADSIQAGIVIVDRKTHRILNANPRAAGMIGTDADEITGQVCDRFISPVPAGRTPGTDPGQDPAPAEGVLVTGNGTRVPVLKSTVSTVLDGNDVLIVSFFDISRQKQSEDEVLQKNKRLLTISELEREFAELPYGRRVEDLAAKKLCSMTGAVVATFNIYDPVARLLRATTIEIAPGILESLPGAWEKMTGWLGMQPEEITIPVSQEQYRDIHRSAVATIRTITELSHGKITPFVSASIQALSGIDRFILIPHSIDGELYGTSVIGLRPDLPDPSAELLDSYGRIVAVSLRRQQAEAALRESEEKFRSYVETSPDIIWEMDLQGTIRYVSPQIRTIMGFSPEEIIGRSVTEMVPEQIKSQIIRELADYGSLNGSLAPFEVPARHRDGRTLVIEIRPSVTDTNGKRAGFRGLAVDITERKRAEEALHRANRQLGLLTGITRHDILNKVSVILGYLRIAEKKNTDPAIGDYLRKVDAATTAIRSQIEFTRVYQDLGTHEPQWLWLDEVMPRLYLPPAVALKADGQGIQVFADPMLERVFFNLLDNSIRHGQRVSEIRVMPLRAGEDLVVVWEDNGIGIPAGEKERIFERGFGRNSGLGMFMVREILSLTGITIRETGVPGTGSRFEIVVPNGAFRITEDDKTGTTIRKNPVLKPSTAGQSGAPPGTSSTTGQ
jgi:PAS domain S-box-containing protein